MSRQMKNWSLQAAPAIRIPLWRNSDYSDYNFLWVRWKPTLLKPVYMLMEKKVSDKNKNIKMNVQVDGKCGVKQAELNADYNTKAGLKGKIFRNPIMRGTWMFFALVDYFFQFHIKTLSFILTGKNIIFDRFYLDLFVDQGINFGFSPDRISKEIQKYRFLFPRMDNYVYRMKPEYGVDRGLYGKKLFGINAMHEVLSGGHQFLGVIMGNRDDVKTVRSVLNMHNYIIRINRGKSNA